MQTNASDIFAEWLDEWINRKFGDKHGKAIKLDPH